MAELAGTLPRTALDGWLDDVVMGSRLASARALGMALPHVPYRIVSVTMDFDGADRNGQLLVVLPRLAVPELVAPSGGTDRVQDWARRFLAAVMVAPAMLDAQLHAMSVPLSRVTRL